MQPNFKPPKDEAEFKERAEKISADAARSILSTLEHRRVLAVTPLDVEIEFYRQVLKFKESK